MYLKTVCVFLGVLAFIFVTGSGSDQCGGDQNLHCIVSVEQSLLVTVFITARFGAGSAPYLLE